jgi:lipopolysaccharide transport system ATP-binding protein
MLDKAQDSVSMISSGADVTFAVSIQSELERLDKVIVTMSVLDAHEQPLFRCRSDILDSGFTRLPGDGQFLLTIPRLPLMPGIYYANLVCMVNGILADHIKSAFSFQVTDGDFFGTGKLPPTQGGSFLVDFAWKYKPNPQGNGIKGVVCSPGSSD